MLAYGLEKMTDRTATPGTLLLGEILIADEPAHIGVTTFRGDGTVLLTVNFRAGADVSQLMLGLSAQQALQLIERLSAHSDEYRRAVAEGHGGVRFPDRAA
jgi:hypothetical protein